MNNSKNNIKTKKVIIHIDVDSFFVSCETALRPELLNKEIAIGQNIPNSIAVSISYEAKNKGARVPFTISSIKKHCENLIVIEPNLKLYRNFAKKIYDFLYKNYSKLIQIVSIDEWYIDATNIWQKHGSIKNLVLEIQEKLLKELSMPVSIGVSFNKFLAKMATATNKPLGITFITYNNFQDIIWPMPISNYYGLGKVKYSQLHTLGINTIGDLAKCKEYDPKIRKIFLKQTEKYLNNANGIGDDFLKLENNVLSSISREKTFINGASEDRKEIYASLNDLCLRISKALLKRNICGKSISVNIDLKNQTKSKSMQINKLINSVDDIYLYASLLLTKLWNNETLICIGVRISKIEYSFQNFMNQSLFEFKEVNNSNKVENIIENVNAKMKDRIVMSGKEFKDFQNSSQNKFR